MQIKRECDALFQFIAWSYKLNKRMTWLQGWASDLCTVYPAFAYCQMGQATLPPQWPSVGIKVENGWEYKDISILSTMAVEVLEWNIDICLIYHFVRGEADEMTHTTTLIEWFSHLVQWIRTFPKAQHACITITADIINWISLQERP